MDPQKVYDEVFEEERESGASEQVASARAEAAAERARLGSPHPKEARFWVSEQGPEPRRRTSVETDTTSEPVTAADVDTPPNPAEPGLRSDQDIAPGVSTQPATELRPEAAGDAETATRAEEPATGAGEDAVTRAGVTPSPGEESPGPAERAETRAEEFRSPTQPAEVPAEERGPRTEEPASREEAVTRAAEPATRAEEAGSREGELARAEPSTAEEGARLPSSQLMQAEEKPEDDQALQSQWDTQARLEERERLAAERRAEVEGLIDTGVPMVAAAETVRGPSPIMLALYVLVPLAAALIFVLSLSGGGAGEASPSGGGASQPHNTLTDITVSAQNVAFDTKTITAAAGKKITVHFDNKDSSSVDHNIAFYTDRSAKQTIYKGKVIPGGSTADYSFKTPTKPGSYFFRCDVHPTSMFGTFVVKK